MYVVGVKPWPWMNQQGMYSIEKGEDLQTKPQGKSRAIEC